MSPSLMHLLSKSVINKSFKNFSPYPVIGDLSPRLAQIYGHTLALVLLMSTFPGMQLLDMIKPLSSELC